MASILSSLQKNKKQKGDRLFLIPIVTIALSVIIFVSFILKDKLITPGDGVDEPFSVNLTAEQTFNKMKDDESFLLFTYAEWCPFCKQMMFGSSEARSGRNGALLKWMDTDEVGKTAKVSAAWENNLNDSGAIDKWYKDLDQLFVDNKMMDDFNWREEVVEVTDQSDIIFKNAKPIEPTRVRPGVPTLLAIYNGRVTALYSGADLKIRGLTKFYNRFVLNTDNIFPTSWT